MVQEISEAETSNSITSCTTALALSTKCRIDRSFDIEQLPHQVRRNRGGSKPLAIDAGQPDPAPAAGLGVGTPHLLLQGKAGAAGFAARNAHLKRLVEAGRAQVVEFYPAHGEQDARAPAARVFAILKTAKDNGVTDAVVVTMADASDGPADVVIYYRVLRDEAAGAAERARARAAGIGIMAMKGLPKRAEGAEALEKQDLYASLCTSMLSQSANVVLASMGSHQIVDMYRNILDRRLGYLSPRLERRYWAEQQGKYCRWSCSSLSCLSPF